MLCGVNVTVTFQEYPGGYSDVRRPRKESDEKNKTVKKSFGARLVAMTTKDL